MILFADSGSTKTTWQLVDNKDNANTCVTGGINPFQSDSEEIFRLMKKEFSLPREGINEIRFYGAGCAMAAKKQIVEVALQRFFDIKNVHVDSDLLMAARSLCGRQAGVACILGTGSNSCYYDGQNIVHNVSPLGYVLGDEGSGSAIGRKLLSDVLKNQLPKYIRELFFETYKVTSGEILDNVYSKPFPNRYLAQYARFVLANIDRAEMKMLAMDCFRDFFQRNVLQYEEAKRMPVHFTGSIAFYFSEIVKEVAEEFSLKQGKITQYPMSGLIDYHFAK